MELITVGHRGGCFQMKSFHLRDMGKGKKQVMVTFVATKKGKKVCYGNFCGNEKRKKVCYGNDVGNSPMLKIFCVITLMEKKKGN